MNFDFKLSPKVTQIMQEKQRQLDEQKKKENEVIAKAQKEKAMRNSMQSTVLNQLASRQPTNPNASVPNTPSVESRQGW